MLFELSPFRFLTNLNQSKNWKQILIIPLIYLTVLIDIQNGKNQKASYIFFFIRIKLRIKFQL